MLGRKAEEFQQHRAVCLEDFVPHKHFYRQLEAKLDLTFIPAVLATCDIRRLGAAFENTPFSR